MSAHDRWLANYHADVVTAYCANPKCGNHDGANVTYVTEYGQGWYEPEECGSCGGEWLEDMPPEPRCAPGDDDHWYPIIAPALAPKDGSPCECGDTTFDLAAASQCCPPASM